MTVEPPTRNEDSAHAPTVDGMAARMIDTWFPCREVDRAVKTADGSGRSEKSLITWFASRPTAQARAAVLCSLLPDTETNRADIRSAVGGNESALERLHQQVLDQFDGRTPVVLDVFSGRGIIPLEAAKLGVAAVGTDLSPVATLGGRLLAQYALQDWGHEPHLPWADRVCGQDEDDQDEVLFDATDVESRLLADVQKVLSEVGERVTRRVQHAYPMVAGVAPWAYLWTVTIPCDGCRRRIPLLGSLVLRHPYSKTADEGQSMCLEVQGDSWRVDIARGAPRQTPTFAATAGRRGKTAQCPFHDCRAVHSLDAVKAKGFAGQYGDVMIAVAEIEAGGKRKVFRAPTVDEEVAARLLSAEDFASRGDLSAVPDELIPAGNTNTIQAALFGYPSLGSLMNPVSRLCSPRRPKRSMSCTSS